jgi:hypothetical protein
LRVRVPVFVNHLVSPDWVVQVEQGADLLDINMDDGLIEGVGAMTRFVNLLVADPETSRVPFMIDSSKVTLQPLLICENPLFYFP